MEELAFDVMEELHFVTSFQSLRAHLACEEQPLLEVLSDMIERGWVRSVPSPQRARQVETPAGDSDLTRQFFLATKEGLLAHHGMGR